MCGIVAVALPTGDVAGVLIAGIKESHEELLEQDFDFFPKTDREVLARGDNAYLRGPQGASKEVNTIHTPCSHPKLQSLLHTTAVQLLVHEVALLRGTDIDQPRNLAKSVIVE